MTELRNRVVRLKCYGGPDQIEVGHALMPSTGSRARLQHRVHRSCDPAPCLRADDVSSSGIRARLRCCWRNRSAWRRCERLSDWRARRRSDRRWLECRLSYAAGLQSRSRTHERRCGRSGGADLELDDGVPVAAPRGARAARPARARARRCRGRHSLCSAKWRASSSGAPRAVRTQN
jgi:hypothetical protein